MPNREDLPSNKAWEAAHPPGVLAYREALAPDGVYGRWLRTLPVAVRIGDVIFVHGGLAPGSTDLGEVNESVRREIEEFDLLRQRGIEGNVVLPSQSRQQMRWALGQKLAAATGEGAAPADGITPADEDPEGASE